MLERLTAFFSAPTARPLPEPDARLALAALLVRMAKADDHMALAELQQIDRILAERNGLSPLAAARLRADAERLERAVPETERFAELIRDAVPYEERFGVVEALWRVAHADGIGERREEDLVHLVETLLGIDSTESQAARAAAADSA